MKSCTFIRWISLGISLFFMVHAPTSRAMGTAFTYQGQLQKNGANVTSACMFDFRLFDALTGGTQVGGTLTRSGMAMSNGVFSTALDFGATAFSGASRWLEVSAKCTGDTAFTLLSPLQELTPAPYSLNADKLDGQDAAAFWRTIGNAGTNPTTNFLGTTDNQALEVRVNNARVMRLEPNATSPNIIAGYNGNSVTSGVAGATISGGGESGYANQVTDDYGTVGGGDSNTASGPNATVGGGYNNTAGAFYGTVGGGHSNTACDWAATVSGGSYNTASGINVTVSGGGNNTASGVGATVSGGASNTVSGEGVTVSGVRSNTASGQLATVSGGDNNTASGSYATVSGGADNTTGSLYATVSGGNSNTAGGIIVLPPGGAPKPITKAHLSGATAPMPMWPPQLSISSLRGPLAGFGFIRPAT